MTHPTQEALLDLALEVLPPSRADELRGHLAECAECSQAFARLEEEQAVLAGALSAAPPLPAGLQRAVLGAVAREPIPGTRRLPGLLAVAAALAMAAGLAFILGEREETPKQELLRQLRNSELLALGLEELQ